MKLTFDGMMTKDEYLVANRLASRPIMRKGLVLFDAWLLFAGVTTLLGGLGAWLLFVKHLYVGVILLILAALFLGMGIKLYNLPHQQWQINKNLHMKRSGMITENGFEMNTSIGQSRLQWANLRGYGEYQGVMVLFDEGNCFYLFSRRFFTADADWDSFCVLVRQKLKQSHQILVMTTTQRLVWALIALATLIVVLRLLHVL